MGKKQKKNKNQSVNVFSQMFSRKEELKLAKALANSKGDVTVNAEEVLTKDETSLLENTLEKFANNETMTFQEDDVASLAAIQGKLKNELLQRFTR